MGTLLSNLRSGIEKRSQYRHTVKALNSMSHALSHDVGIIPGDAEHVAYRAVYGTR